MARNMELLTNDLVKEKPILRIILGVCPALTVTVVASHSLVLGGLVTLLLLCSNLTMAVFHKILPTPVQTPCYVTIVAGFLTIMQLLIQANSPQLEHDLGIFLPLLVVNCLILGKIHTSPLIALQDSLVMGVGFTIFMTILGVFREILGAGTCFGAQILPETLQPFTLVTSPPGGFLIFGLLLAVIAGFTREKPLEESVAEEIMEEMELIEE